MPGAEIRRRSKEDIVFEARLPDLCRAPAHWFDTTQGAAGPAASAAFVSSA
jgi:hypothetical protein